LAAEARRRMLCCAAVFPTTSLEAPVHPPWHQEHTHTVRTHFA
jgi:hypothetical protein